MAAFDWKLGVEVWRCSVLCKPSQNTNAGVGLGKAGAAELVEHYLVQKCRPPLLARLAASTNSGQLSPDSQRLGENVSKPSHRDFYNS